VPKTLVTMFCVNAACLVLTFSRGGWIGLLASILPSLVYLSIGGVCNYLFLAYLVAANSLVSMSLLLLLAVLFVEPVRDRVFSIFAGRADSSITSALMQGSCGGDDPRSPDFGHRSRQHRLQQNLPTLPAASF